MHPAPVAAALVLLAQACSGDPTPRPDAEADGEGGEALLVPDVGNEEATTPQAGSLTFVANDNLLIDERLCDLDGDGLSDNSIADLGDAQSALFLASLNAIVLRPSEAFNRWIIHLPEIHDLASLTDDETILVPCLTMDADEPVDPSDDFTGNESFLVRASSLDPCGEPRVFFPNTRILEGVVETTVPREVAIAFGPEQMVQVTDALVFGVIESTGEAAEWHVCGALQIGAIGDLVVPEILSGGFSMLEILVAGGAAFGVPTLPGLSPDLDLDGDGLERFVVDSNSHIERCVDGDLVTIDGPDCWQDARMADGFSVNLRFASVTATIAGPEDDWQSEVEGTCDSPPERSLWDGS